MIIHLTGLVTVLVVTPFASLVGTAMSLVPQGVAEREFDEPEKLDVDPRIGRNHTPQIL